MSDEWSQDLLAAEWGGMSLDILNVEDSFDRSLVAFKYPNVDGAVYRDMGAEPRAMSCTLVFIPPNVISRVTQFLTLAGEGKAKRFIHPLYGSFDARAENIRTSARAEERDYVTISVSFVEEAASTTFVGILEGSKRADVNSAAANLDTALSDASLSSTVGSDATTQADEWEDLDTIDPRVIDLELNELANAIAVDVDTLELADDVTLYPVLNAMTALHNTMRLFAEYLISTAPELTTYTVPEMMPLLAICQELYGGSLGLERMDQLLELNDLADPGLIPAGIVLTVIVP